MVSVRLCVLVYVALSYTKPFVSGNIATDFLLIDRFKSGCDRGYIIISNDIIRLIIFYLDRFDFRASIARPVRIRGVFRALTLDCPCLDCLLGRRCLGFHHRGCDKSRV